MNHENFSKMLNLDAQTQVATATTDYRSLGQII